MQPISNETELKYILHNAYFNATKEFTFSSHSSHMKFLVDEVNKRFAIVKFGDGVYFFEHYHLLNYQLSQNNEIIATGTDYISKTTPQFTKLPNTNSGIIIKIIINDFNSPQFELILLKESTNTNSAEYIEAKNTSISILQLLNSFLDYKTQNESSGHYANSIPIYIKFTTQKRDSLKIKNLPLKAYAIFITVAYIIYSLSQPTKISDKTVKTSEAPSPTSTLIANQSTAQKSAPIDIPVSTATPTATPTSTPVPTPTQTIVKGIYLVDNECWEIFNDVYSKQNELMSNYNAYLSGTLSKVDFYNYCKDTEEYFDDQVRFYNYILESSSRTYLKEMKNLAERESNLAQVLSKYIISGDEDSFKDAKVYYKDSILLSDFIIESRIDLFTDAGYSKEKATKIVYDSLNK